jgi:nucleotide-binding universal stress UspA family protein
LTSAYTDIPEYVLALFGQASAEMRHLVLVHEAGRRPLHVDRLTAKLARLLGADVLVVSAVEIHLHCNVHCNHHPEANCRLVEETVEGLRTAGVHARGEVHTALAGRAWKVIRDVVSEARGDLVIVAEAAAPRVLKMLGLTTAQRLARLSKVPVLIIPARAGS